MDNKCFLNSEALQIKPLAQYNIWERETYHRAKDTEILCDFSPRILISVKVSKSPCSLQHFLHLQLKLKAILCYFHCWKRMTDMIAKRYSNNSQTQVSNAQAPVHSLQKKYPSKTWRMIRSLVWIYLSHSELLPPNFASSKPQTKITNNSQSIRPK